MALDYGFDPTYGFDRPKLRAVEPPTDEPDDLDRFWEETYREAVSQPLELEVSEADDRVGVTYRIVSFRTLRFRTSAYVLSGASPTRGVVVGCGYGGREASDPSWVTADRAVIFPVPIGFQISADGRVPFNEAWQHVIWGIETPETYLLRDCVVSLWKSIDVLRELFGIETAHYSAWSFGGGLGSLGLGWERRFDSAEIGHPTFGWHDFRLKHRCNGSGEAVRRWIAEHPEHRRTLRYFDAVFTIRRFKRPTVFGLSVLDPAVPPPGQFAVAHAHEGPKRVSEFATGHTDDLPIKSEVEAHNRNLAELLGS